MKRGNNYSGPRWTHAQGPKPKSTTPRKSGGLTMSGGSNRKTSIWRDEDLVGSVEPHVDNEGHEVHE